MLSKIPWVPLLIILGFLIWAIIDILNKKGTLQANRNQVDFWPSVLTSLGVLGTFYGISSGLWQFDPENLNDSIPNLLEGLTTAFFTSIIGMASSMGINWWINRITDKDENEHPSEMNEVASRICEAVSKMSAQLAATMEQLNKRIEQQEQRQTMFYNTMVARMDKPISEVQQSLNEAGAAVGGVLASMTNVQASLDNLTQSVNGLPLPMQAILTSVDGIKPHIEASTQGISNLQSKMDDALGHLASQDGRLESIADSAQATKYAVDGLSGQLHAEVENVGQMMVATNALLTQKFDEFSDLLQKSNTESLVKVMEAATKEFQKTMGELVQKLVQENFDQLNQSVERMNTWQQENKEMISQLTDRYKAMNEAFQQTSTVFGSVAQYAETLSGASGTLARLVTELQKVMVDDTRFSEITNQLTEAVEQTKNNISELHDHTTELNQWIRDHRDICDAAAALVQKLEELNKIRDYGEQFWKETKRSLEEGVTLVTNATSSLNDELTEIDNHFYDRLNATLANLDACISKLIDEAAKKH